MGAVALRSALVGVGAGLLILAGVVARIVASVTAGNRWRDFRNL